MWSRANRSSLLRFRRRLHSASTCVMTDAPRVAFEANGTLRVVVRDEPLELQWRRSARARRLCLRTGGRGVELVVPADTTLSEAGAFAAAHADWIARQNARAPVVERVGPGSVIPVSGLGHTIVHRPEPGALGPHGERVLWRTNDQLHVRGAVEHVARRIEDWLRDEARSRLGNLSRAKAEAIGLTPTRITVRDTVSRWGSCSSSGALSFCWRLVMAPPYVLDYVAAHEVAHLRHMNHGRAFWRTCASLLEDGGRAAGRHPTEQRIQAARSWLRRNGAALHAYRFSA